MDAIFWLVVTIAVIAIVQAARGWWRVSAQAIELDEQRETIDRQAEVIAALPARGDRGRFAKRVA